ncbi:MAG: hypothetical protein EOP83_02145 [Verrucomicrobiaceae bacterium]|nr:MAG: hypothetical protein EOP83_02145 [Verrucomicrobiaceae bacterium]
MKKFPDILKSSVGTRAIRSILDGTAYMSESRDRMMQKTDSGAWETYVHFREGTVPERLDQEQEYIDWLHDRGIRFNYERPGYTALIPNHEMAVEWRLRWM